MFTIPKSDGIKPRFLLDCVARNLVTEKDKTPLPSIQQILEFCQSRTFRSKIDLADGYHNIRIEPDSVKHSTFLCHKGYFNSHVMQQGDCNAPATMMKCMQEILKAHLYKDLIVYLDDIIIASKTYDDHVRVLKEVLTTLEQEKFLLNKKKCHFFADRLEILGHVINQQGLHTDPNKISLIKNYPQPETRTQLQSFIGLVNYLSKFYPHMASDMTVLTDLQGNTKDWVWTPTHTTAFNKVKDGVNKDLTLTALNYESDEKIFLVTDASDLETGAYIGQGTLENIRPALFHSRKFNPAQQQYPTLQKELLAIVDAVEYYAPQLRHVKFTCLTDHQPLVTFMHKPQKTQKLRRWQQMLSEYDFTIQYQPGIKNATADLLSRKSYKRGEEDPAVDSIPTSTDPTQAYQPTETIHLTPPITSTSTSSPNSTLQNSYPNISPDSGYISAYNQDPITVAYTHLHKHPYPAHSHIPDPDTIMNNVSHRRIQNCLHCTYGHWGCTCGSQSGHRSEKGQAAGETYAGERQAEDRGRSRVQKTEGENQSKENCIKGCSQQHKEEVLQEQYLGEDLQPSYIQNEGNETWDHSRESRYDECSSGEEADTEEDYATEDEWDYEYGRGNWDDGP